MDENRSAGRVGWVDLTVADGEGALDFYRNVVGFEVLPVDMGGYQDFCLVPAGGGAPVAGVCHARGANGDLPPVWLVYFTVSDLELAVARALDLGAQCLRPIGPTGGGRFAVLRDPAGAVFALHGP